MFFLGYLGSLWTIRIVDFSLIADVFDVGLSSTVGGCICFVPGVPLSAVGRDQHFLSISTTKFLKRCDGGLLLLCFLRISGTTTFSFFDVSGH